MRWRAGLALALLLLLVTCASPSTPPPATLPGIWFVEVERQGGCWLGPETLRTVGVEPSGEASPMLRLSWAGQAVPYLPLRTDEGWGIFFFAPDHSTRYTRRSAFRLEVGVAGEVTSSVGQPSQVAGRESLPYGGLASAHWEQDARYLPQAETDAPWFWEPIYAPGAVTHTLTLTDALPGPMTVTLHLWSHTASAANPDHLLRLTWDGRMVGEWEWDGQGMQHLAASWEEGQPGEEHTLAVETPALPGAEVAVIWLDGWDVTYRRQVDASGEVWQAEGAALRVEDAGPEARVLDVTDPLAPQDLGPLPADGMVETTPGHRYWIGRPTESPKPLAVRAAEQVVGQADNLSYLIVAPPEFHSALQPLLEYRRSQGLQTAVVSPQAVYDTFGNGQPDPQALRTLVQSLPTLRYLLVVGDGSAEPWGYDGAAGALRVVTPLTRTTVLGETPADALLGSDPEGRPTVAVGRFPATTPGQVAAMVEKTLRWESREGPPAILLVTDDEPEFEALADEITALLPTGTPEQRLSAGGDEESRAAALEALGQGPVWLNYTGHGSLTLLGDEGILTVDDDEAWREPALAVTWTCLAAYFIHPAQDSMAETWLRAPRGGVVAFLGPTGETTTGEQTAFARAFYRALAEQERLGDAWLAALREGGSPDVMWGYVLLGDPALRLRQ